MLNIKCHIPSAKFHIPTEKEVTEERNLCNTSSAASSEDEEASSWFPDPPPPPPDDAPLDVVVWSANLHLPCTLTGLMLDN